MDTRTREEFIAADLELVFRDHVYCSDKHSRGQEYAMKLLTLGFKSRAKPMPLDEFMRWIGPGDYVFGDPEDGTLAYVTENEEFDGWVWMFAVKDRKVVSFGTNGFNIPFIQDAKGQPRHIHEIADAFAGSSFDCF